jgi:hypothetical protein
MHRDHSEDLGVDRRIKEVKWEATEWIHLVQNTNQWWALVT